MTVHGKPVTVGATKIRGLLGALAFKCNEPVAIGYLAEALWDEPPQDPNKPLQTYVSRLRRALDVTDLAEVISEHGYYRLRATPSSIDYHEFVAKARTGHRAAGQGDHFTAAALFEEAVNLWRGPPLTDIKTSWARRQQEALHIRDLLPTQCALLEVKLTLGEHDYVLDMLPSLLADHSDNEWLARLWIRVLAATNRAQEVSAYYRDFCERLKAEHGASPGSDLVAVYESATLRQSPRATSDRITQIPDPPRATPSFTGRAELLHRLDTLLAGPEPAVMLVALDGRPGVGKTSLVLHWARGQKSRFADGILYLDLAGYSQAKPVEPGRALAALLDMLGTSPGNIPTATDSQAALLRQTLNGRRVLVILDNVRDSAHVRPILAGTVNSPTIITSRLQLNGIAFRDAAERIIVPELSTAEATRLLAGRIGPRATAEPEAVRDLVALCDRLPLAVRIVSEHIASRAAVPIGDLAEELRQTKRLLDVGSHGDDDSTTLRSTYAFSYRALQPDQARLFRLLGLLPTTQFSVAAASAVGSVDRAVIDHLLDVLVAAHLVEQESAGRYRIHDSLHQYAADSVHDDEPAEDRDQAARRLLTWYLESARAARSLLTADPHQVPDLPTAEPVTPLEFPDTQSARRWFELERESLVALTHLAARHGHHEHVWRLAACLNEINFYGDLHELLAVHERGAESAALAGQQAASAGCRNNMGHVYQLLDDALRAGHCFEQAYQAFHAVGDKHGEAVSLHNIGTTHLMLGDPAEAIAWYRRALILFTADNAEWAIANVHSRLGDAFGRLDQHTEAASHYQLAWRVYERLDDQRRQGNVLNRLARLHLDMDRPKSAIEYGSLALDQHDRTGDRGGAAEVLCTLATAKIRQRAPSQAAADAMEAARAHRELGNVAGEATSLSLLADALTAAGETTLAEETWDQVTHLLDALDDPRSTAVRERMRLSQRTLPSPRSGVTRRDHSAGQ
jgi:DNA-binding SARP family transcriptional activator/tetratricopeptide (TPR) repeat protein